ncbi:MAG TPA: (deoxy)nucleoside triphosphate pyrophosphohydrolase [Mariprofundaceae bacterium]|nr:(deoxy)nucleoside triphosphate pyrophosphohydrolase [Mariprofundaceae bacterium]
MKEQVIALVAAFNSDREVLLLKRPDNVHQGNLWSFPGGKVDEGETPLDAAVRELREETGLTGKLWRHLGKASHSYDDRTLHFLFFVCHCPDTSNLKSESPCTRAHLDQLDDYPMPEANRKLIPMLFIPEMDEYLNQRPS